VTVRVAPLSAAETERVQPLATRAFHDLAVRHGQPPREDGPEVAEHYRRMHAHLRATGSVLGAWDGDDLVGAAVSYERGATWVLALLVVEPGRQSLRAGSTLLAAALRSSQASVRILHASRDARAMRAYAQAGFRLLPALSATGQAHALRDAPEVADADLSGDLSGCRHLAVDLRHVVASGGRTLVLADGRDGVAVVHGPPGHPYVTVLAAPDATTGRDLLRGALAVAGERPGARALGPLAPQEHWAVEVALEAGLELSPSGPVAVAGVPAPLDGLLPPPAVLI
jgi:GNAT superfamily N-acetyltransferase